jgi:hypothetical protein
VLRWIAVTGLALVSLLVATTILIAYSQVGSVDDARSYQYRYRPLQMGTQIQVVFEHNGVVYVANCSLGFPAYYDSPLYPGSPIRVVVYGVITASHCGLRDSLVYQNVTGSNNYIGSMRDEGRFTYGAIIHDPNDVDATFVIVERYTYFSGSPRPPPQIVSAYIRDISLAGSTVPIGSYISKEQDLWIAREASLLINKAGRTTGLEAGYVRYCQVNPTRQVACYYTNPNWGWLFITTAYGAISDSGGPAYEVYTVPVDRMYVKYAKVYGTLIGYSRTETWGEVSPRCIISNGVEMCMPTAFTILYNVTTLRGVTPLTRG